MTPAQKYANAAKTREYALLLFPKEIWKKVAENIYAAKSRFPKNKQQNSVFEKELVQAEILTKQGSTVYLLPEIGKFRQKTPDAIVDGVLTEFKTIKGGLNNVGKRFKEAIRQGGSAFLKIDADLSVKGTSKNSVSFSRCHRVALYSLLIVMVYNATSHKYL